LPSWWCSKNGPFFSSLVKKVSLGENYEKCQKWKRSFFSTDNTVIISTLCWSFSIASRHENELLPRTNRRNFVALWMPPHTLTLMAEAHRRRGKEKSDDAYLHSFVCCIAPVGVGGLGACVRQAVSSSFRFFVMSSETVRRLTKMWQAQSIMLWWKKKRAWRKRIHHIGLVYCSRRKWVLLLAPTLAQPTPAPPYTSASHWSSSHANGLVSNIRSDWWWVFYRFWLYHWNVLLWTF
jgi:hypothetical protein